MILGGFLECWTCVVLKLVNADVPTLEHSNNIVIHDV